MMLLELLMQETVSKELNWDRQKIADYISFKYELTGHDLDQVLSITGIPLERYRQQKFQDMVAILYTEGYGFYVTPNKTICCSECRIVSLNQKARLYGPHTMCEFSTVSRALEYLVRFIRREIKL